LETWAAMDKDKDKDSSSRTRVNTSRTEKVMLPIIKAVEDIITTTREAEIEVATEVVEEAIREVDICNKMLTPTNSTHNNKLSNNLVALVILKCNQTNNHSLNSNK
jgi:hypothetical protein